MNHPARIFSRLTSAWHQDVTDEAIDILAADLTAQVAAGRGPVCVGLIRAEAVKRLFGLACFLDTYGLTLRQRYLKNRDFAFVIVEVQVPSLRPSDYAGAVVVARSQPQIDRVAA
jgi:hypothetical protein